MILTYGRVLSTTEKALQELMEEYRGVGKFLQDLVESQERNMAQLERIGAIVEWRWDSKESKVKEDRDDKEGSKNGSRESQEEGTPLSTSC